MPSYIEQSLAKLEEFEGSIPWMYLDTVGKVTVGVGLMLPDAAAARKLSFVLGDRPATEDEVAAEFARVEAMAMGRPAQFYHRAGGPVLPQAEIDSLLRTVLLGFEGELRAKLAGYDSFPDSVKLALLDMAYNLGPAGLLREYPRMLRAVEAGNWAQAAATSFRHGPGAARNQWTQKMFLQSVVGTIKAQGDGVLRQCGYGLVGIAATLAERLRRNKG
jgi:GH24 family phage-related lysozyme (muramidase)